MKGSEVYYSMVHYYNVVKFSLMHYSIFQCRFTEKICFKFYISLRPAWIWIPFALPKKGATRGCYGRNLKCCELHTCKSTLQNRSDTMRTFKKPWGRSITSKLAKNRKKMICKWDSWSSSRKVCLFPCCHLCVCPFKCNFFAWSDWCGACLVCGLVRSRSRVEP